MLMTEKLRKFKGHKSLSWGIQRRVVSIEVACNLYLQILQSNQFKIDESLLIGAVKLLPEQYVPHREDVQPKVSLNNILKNNFENGSYILEFFDEEKINVQFLLNDPLLLNQFNEDVSSVLPIKIGVVSDRLANVIFQLPINNVHFNCECIKAKGEEGILKYQGIKLEVIPKIDDFNFRKLAVRLYEEDADKIISRQKLINIDSAVTDIYFDDCFGTHIEVVDKFTSLLLYKYKFSIMKEMYSNSRVIEPQNRFFEIDGRINRVEVSTNLSHSIFGKSKDKPFDEWVRSRKYEQDLKDLEKSKAFVQYFDGEEEKAFSDLKGLINRYGKHGVYLWDPYLSAVDIKNTLYHHESTYVPMRAITGLKQHNSKEKAKGDMIEEFEKDKKEFLFLDLEVRGKIGSSGYDFHDRFLIFPLDKPKVWSLGISVNQLGASHHILQEVKNAQHILNAFNKLWDGLNDEECLVWKIN